MACPDCGPRLRARYARHFATVAGGQVLYRASIAQGSWPTMRNRLARASADYVRVPAPGGRFTVFTTEGPGDLVTAPPAAIAEAFTAMPSEPACVSSSRAWTISADTPKGAWELVGRELGMLRGPVEPAMLPAGVAAAWSRALTPGPLEAFRRRVGTA